MSTVTSPIDSVAHASTFGSTRSDTNAIPVEKGDVGGLLVERLRAWKHMVGYLEAYVEQTESMHKHLRKEYEKVLKTVQEPLKEGHHFDQSVGGVAAFFENLRANTVRLGTSHTETAAALKTTILSALSALHKEIKERQKHVGNECEKGSKAVAKARNTTQSHIELLAQHSSAYDSVGGVSAGTHTHGLHVNTGGKSKPDNDPYLLKRGVLHRLHKQVLEENGQRQELLAVQQRFETFEEHILQTVQQTLGTFYQICGDQNDRSKTLYGDIAEKGQSIPLGFEWSNFSTRNIETLIDPDSPMRSVEAISFANEDHGSTKPLIEGALQRKGKIMRSYNQAYYVLTPSKYLHEFKDSDVSSNFSKDLDPEMSLYLPDCTVGALAGGKFVISGKDSGSALKGIRGKSEYAFKAGTNDEGAKWHNLIAGAAGLTTNDTPTATPISPPGDEKVKPPAYSRQSTQESGITQVSSKGSDKETAGAATAAVAEKS